MKFSSRSQVFRLLVSICRCWFFGQNQSKPMESIDSPWKSWFATIFHETLACSSNPSVSEIFSENVLGVGYHSNMPRNYISAFSRTGTDRQSPILKPWKIIEILKKTLVPKLWASFKTFKTMFPHLNITRVYSLYLLLFLVDSKESSFSPRVPAPEYTAHVFAVSSVVFGGP